MPSSCSDARAHSRYYPKPWSVKKDEGQAVCLFQIYGVVGRKAGHRKLSVQMERLSCCILYERPTLRRIPCQGIFCLFWKFRGMKARSRWLPSGSPHWRILWYSGVAMHRLCPSLAVEHRLILNGDARVWRDLQRESAAQLQGDEFCSRLVSVAFGATLVSTRKWRIACPEVHVEIVQL